MSFKGLFLISILLLLGSASFFNRSYHKEYYQTGQLKSQGWKKGEVKTGYWFYYRINGALAKEGHYRNGKMASWWLFYDEHGVLNHKCQLNRGKKDGYCLKYSNKKLSSAVKYTEGKRIKEWHDLHSFRRENKLSDLR